MTVPNLAEIADHVKRNLERMNASLYYINNMYHRGKLKNERFEGVITGLEAFNKQRENESLPYLHYKYKLAKIKPGSEKYKRNCQKLKDSHRTY